MTQTVTNPEYEKWTSESVVIKTLLPTGNLNELNMRATVDAEIPCFALVLGPASMHIQRSVPRSTISIGAVQ